MEFESASVIVKHISSAASTASASSCDEPEPVSRTFQYRKVMKPLLERKRRARINRCLDDLKDLMVNALSSEGENVSKLEKADILELTVQHLRKQRHQQLLQQSRPTIDTDRFRAGFTHAANEVSRCLAATPGVNVALGTKLMTHLGHRLNEINVERPLSINTATTAAAAATTSVPAYSPISSASSSCFDNESQSGDEHMYAMPLTPASSARSQHSNSPSPPPQQQQSNGSMWRPW